MKILLIEDEVKTVDALKRGLEENGFDVEIAYDGETGYIMASRNIYNVIVSDLIIPKINGLELCFRLRQKGVLTPLLMLTALGTTEDKITGFERGADDYLVKPFEFRELLARINSLTKRQSDLWGKGNILRIADLELNLDTKTAFRAGKEIALTAKEFALMEYLMLNKNKVVSKVDIAEKVWDISFDRGTNVIEVYVNYLRKKIDFNSESKLIQTVHGLGYVLKGD